MVRCLAQVRRKTADTKQHIYWCFMNALRLTDEGNVRQLLGNVDILHRVASLQSASCALILFQCTRVSTKPVFIRHTTLTLSG